MELLRDVLVELELDPEKDTPGRSVVRHIGKALSKAMHLALGSDDPAAAELVAAECVTLAETKDHLNWGLMSQLSEQGTIGSSVLADAVDELESEEAEHLYHTSGWTRELWMKSLGTEAVLPPPEEEQDVQTLAQAAKAKETRTQNRAR